jgi:hypothetical protein
LIDPIAASSVITTSRSTSSVTATIPAHGVNRGSGAPIHMNRRNRRPTEVAA